MDKNTPNWLSKYPFVAAMLQHSSDELDYIPMALGQDEDTMQQRCSAATNECAEPTEDN